MAETRIRIGKQTELSAAPYSIVVTDINNEQQYTAPGSNGEVLTIVGGVPTYNPISTSSFTITDGTTSQVINSGDTLTITSGNGITATISPTDLLTIAAKISSDSGNDITFGTDGGLYLSKDSLLTNVTWNDATNNLVLTFDNGSTVNVPIVDAISTFLSDFTVAGDVGAADLINNHETVSFIGGDGIRTTISPNTVTFNLRTQRDVFTGLTTGSTVTLTQTPLLIFSKTRNGLNLLSGASNDYTISGTTVTMNIPFGITPGAASPGEQVEFFYTY